MPSFIKTAQSEKMWSKAKSIVRKSYPELKRDSDKFWALTTSIYKKLRGRKMKKTASSRVLQALQKIAYVPLTPAAQDAIMAQQGGGSMPPVDPNMMGGAPMQQGAMPQPQGMQTVPGPNGEPIDPETGFIVVDPVQGIEMEPTTGILFVKPTGEFMTPDGQPIPPEQAQMMIEQAMSGAAPAGGMPAPQPEAPPVNDPAAMMASGNLTIDPQSGLPIDLATGMFMPTPQPGAMAEGALEGGMEAAMPGITELMDKLDQSDDRQDKLNKRMLHDIAGTRTDLQGMRRELQQMNDDHDTLLARLENVLGILERMLGGSQANDTRAAM